MLPCMFGFRMADRRVLIIIRQPREGNHAGSGPAPALVETEGKPRNSSA
jgi:hypothetical protein